MIVPAPAEYVMEGRVGMAAFTHYGKPGALTGS